MTDQQVIEHLAKVMGWHRSKWYPQPAPFAGLRYWKTKKGEERYIDFQWNPLTSIEHCLGEGGLVDAMLKKGWRFKLISPSSYRKLWAAAFWKDHDDAPPSSYIERFNRSCARVICEAAYEATKEG